MIRLNVTVELDKTGRSASFLDAHKVNIVTGKSNGWLSIQRLPDSNEIAVVRHHPDAEEPDEIVYSEILP